MWVNIEQAFSKIKFRKVIYSLKFADERIVNLYAIRDSINQKLIKIKCIEYEHQIKYCVSPWIPYAEPSWAKAIKS